MRDYVIVTDSCCDFSAQMAGELELQIVPLSFTIEGGEYHNFPDNREMDPSSAPVPWGPPPPSAWASFRRP